VGKQPASKILVVRCECGFEARGSLTKLVPIVQRHGRDVHNMKTSPEQVAAMAHPV
jgi:predicted small metal-binding protein